MLSLRQSAAERGEITMNRTAQGALTGLAVGVAAGTMAYAAANLTTARQRRKMKRAAAKAIHSVEGFAGDLAGMMKS